MKENIIKEKSFAFAVLVVNFYKYLCENKKEFVLSKQLLRAGTSIGSMVRESKSAESKKDFIHKLGIALKEADESMYWLELLQATDYLSDEQFESIYVDAQEIFKILTAIIKSSKESM